MKNDHLEIAGEVVAPGEIRRIEIPVGRLPTQTMLSLPVTVINGVKTGARLWISAAIHGDEINGVEIIRQVVSQINPKLLNGSVIAVPIVNIFGFIEQSRYLPDRRDLNRSFPGSENGSLAARLANLFMRKIVSKCTHGIDLHTAAIHRINLPQIRANLQDQETYYFAKSFCSPIIINANTRDGSLRQAVSNLGIPILLYEGGEALRFDPMAIKVGVDGIFRVMNNLEMYPLSPSLVCNIPQEVYESKWIRAPRGGIFLRQIELGQIITKKETIGVVTDAFGDTNIKIKASIDGIIIGYTQNPLVNQGDALVHIGFK